MWSWQSARHYWSGDRWGHGRMTAVTESPLPPTQQGIKDKQTCGHRKRRWNDVCVTVGVVGRLHSFTLLLGRQSCFKFPVLPFLLVNSPSDLGLLVCTFTARTLLLYWIRLYCIGVSLLHAWAHAHAFNYPIICEMWTILGGRYWSAACYTVMMVTSSFCVRIWPGMALRFTWTAHTRHIWCPHRSSKPALGPWKAALSAQFVRSHTWSFYSWIAFTLSWGLNANVKATL